MQYRQCVEIIFCSLLLVFSCHAAEKSSDDLRRIDHHPERGWYFYETHPDFVMLTQKKTALPSIKSCGEVDKWRIECGFINPTSLKLSASEAYDLEQREYHGLMRQYALYPDRPDAVYAFQRFNYWVISQAMTAAYTWQYNLAQHPDVDANATIPVSQFAERLMRHLEDQSERGFWKSLSQSGFFVLVSRADDPYCLAQDKLMRLLEQETGVAVWDLSIDQSQLPGARRVMHYPLLSASQQKAISRQLDFSWLPTVYLYLKPMALQDKIDEKTGAQGQWIRVSNGLTTLSDIKARTLNFVMAYRHAMVEGAAHGKSVTPDFRYFRDQGLYPLLAKADAPEGL